DGTFLKPDVQSVSGGWPPTSYAGTPFCSHRTILRFRARYGHQSTAPAGRKQDRARVAGGQKHEMRYAAKKTGKPAGRIGLLTMPSIFCMWTAMRSWQHATLEQVFAGRCD